ncbi:tetratricopeptide repeat protein [Pontivivens insulae]|uniref:Uncharacterized protein n=1 Tax=Pontivivens insulae TaxID=1639689 RepID=A0A2R8AC00_9RHOB|nr:tetratricopeptide repeat protein [Pontivivens insulae]RED11094.1 tetratricopeptide repeat protein [Pontivivens insulae]SPF29731.1 hypothetical protein POI8812_02047 [Pontivivens insulae]
MRQVSIALVALAVTLTSTMPAFAQRTLSELLAELSDPEAQDIEGIESAIVRRWSDSGSEAIDLLVDRGEAALEADDLILAVEHFTAAIDHAPGHAQAWNGRATTFYLQGEYALALSDIRMVLALNPQHFGALTGLGFTLEAMGDFVRAEEALRYAQDVNPHSESVVEALERLELLNAGTSL